MKLIKISFLIIALTAILALPYVMLAASSVTETDENQQTCPKDFNLKQCQEWVLKQAGGGTPGYGTVTEVTEADLANRVGKVIGMVLSVFGIVFLCLVVYSGIQWMTAGGNEEKVTKARERIMRAAIGLGIVVMSWALTKFVVTTMQKTTAPAPQINCTDFKNQTDCLKDNHPCIWTADFNECTNRD